MQLLLKRGAHVHEGLKMSNLFGYAHTPLSKCMFVYYSGLCSYTLLFLQLINSQRYSMCVANIILLLTLRPFCRTGLLER